MACGYYMIENHHQYNNLILFDCNNTMWSFKSAWDSDGHPLLHSLNGNIGRQTWVFDPTAGTDEDRSAIEKLREEFRRNRHEQKHSSDELLRYDTSWYCVGFFIFFSSLVLYDLGTRTRMHGVWVPSRLIHVV